MVRLFGLSALVSATFAASALGQPAPSTQFVVVAAPRHPAVSNLQAAYRSDDPQLVGRLVALRGAILSFDGRHISCSRATRATNRVSVGQIIRERFPDRPHYGKTYVARPSDFGLALAPATVVAATRFQCVVPGNQGKDWTGATVFPIGGGRWALSLIDDHLLILKPDTGSVRASFDCARAGTVVERTICSDRLLAGWDRSVATAYAIGSGDRDSQRAWLTERDRCGADKACLHESLSLRVSNLLR
jgi:uncharacterized protein YecT (DUF1311 family)